MVKSSFKDDDHDEFTSQYKEMYKKHEWSPLFIDVSVNTGRLKCQYKNLNPQLAFVVEIFHEKYNGKNGIFYEIVLPDTNAHLIQL